MPELITNEGRAAGDGHKMARLQVLRAFAAFSVVAYHLTVRGQSLLGHGFFGGIFDLSGAGVDLFFVLSGFIIFTIHRSDIGSPNRAGRYLKKRIIRIYPIYWIVTLVALPVYLAGYGVGSKRDLAVILKSLILFPQSPGKFPVVNVAWTLSFEMFFYLMFWLLIRFRSQLIALLWVAWLVPCAVFLFLKLTDLWQPPGNLLFTFVFSERNLEFALGCLVAWLIGRVVVPAPRLFLLAGLAAFLGLAFSASLAHGFVPLQDNSVALFAIPSVLMVLGAAAADLGSRRAPPRPLVYLGDASYTLYLIHFGFITAAFLAFRHLGLGGSDLFAPEAIVTGAAAGVAACLIYRYVEKPMLDSLRRRFIPSQLAAPAGATDTVATPLSTKDGL